LDAVSRLVNKTTARLLYLAWLNLPFARRPLDGLMRRVFDSLAPGWGERTHWQDRLAPLDEALARIDASPARVADLGCGTGEATIALAQRFASAWVIGVDISPEMLARARVAAREAGTAIQFHEEPIEHTSIEDDSVDLVVLVNTPPPFAEIARILAPAGRAVVVYTQGPATFFYSGPNRLRRGFARQAMTELCHGGAGKGEYFVAAHAAVLARSGIPSARERSAQTRVAGVPR
jgi:SAM-dependent methyltransferase